MRRLPPAFRRCRGFTLAEVLAALLLMAILIPVTVHGVSVASRARDASIAPGSSALAKSNSRSCAGSCAITSRKNSAGRSMVAPRGASPESSIRSAACSR